ncbi:hypothetical protein FA13DRAFT_1727809 [Coprinellus micaceus]|uniref:Uncharacterized protein n=1 Tax=Coprinellus micaceus TaxID=71717 RepID=A0A4Y7TPY3_COPMI|nr:hypothetical protein FA13DRAFT_1727809 [Coprinellus micaceus]
MSGLLTRSYASVNSKRRFPQQFLPSLTFKDTRFPQSSSKATELPGHTLVRIRQRGDMHPRILASSHRETPIVMACPHVHPYPFSGVKLKWRSQKVTTARTSEQRRDNSTGV